jgi:protein TonB
MLTFVKRNLFRMLSLALVVALVFGARRYLLGVHPVRPGEVQRVTLVSPRPEPPRPPEPDPKPAEPAEAEQQPNATREFYKFDDYAWADASPPSPGSPGGLSDDRLGLDATGRGGPDSYGLVGKRGGKDIITLGSATVGVGDGSGGGLFGHGQGGPMAKFAGYAATLQDFIRAELERHSDIRTLDYELEVIVFIGHDGRITRAAIDKSTGIPRMDGAIRQIIAAAPAMPATPPPDMPQPVHLHIASRGAVEAMR